MNVETEFGRAVYGSPTRSELATIFGEMYLEIMEVGMEGKEVLCICQQIMHGTLCMWDGKGRVYAFCFVYHCGVDIIVK